MKKMYKKPQTEKVPMVPETDVLHLGGASPTFPSEPGNAPRHEA